MFGKEEVPTLTWVTPWSIRRRISEAGKLKWLRNKAAAARRSAKNKREKRERMMEHGHR